MLKSIVCPASCMPEAVWEIERIDCNRLLPLAQQENLGGEVVGIAVEIAA